MKENISDCDHTYLKTDKDIYFCVGGDIHSRESVFGQPYYFPKKSIEEILNTQIRKSTLIEDQEFCKIFDVIKPKEYPDFIKDNFKEYYYSPPIWPSLMKVERNQVLNILDPKKGRKDFVNKYKEKDNSLIYLLNLIKQFDTNLYENTGITGSLLLNNDFGQLKNDVDLIIYGQNNIIKSKEFSIEKCTNNNRFSFLDGDKLSSYIDFKSQTYPGKKEMLINLSKKRWDTYFVDDLKIDLTFSANRNQKLNFYDLSLVGKKKIVGKIIDSSNSYYLPTQLQVEAENCLENIIITSRGYICLFERFDMVEIYGEEYLSSENGKKYIVVNGVDNTYLSRK